MRAAVEVEVEMVLTRAAVEAEEKAVEVVEVDPQEVEETEAGARRTAAAVTCGVSARWSHDALEP